MPPRLARLLAAIVAIALVAGAFAVRGALAGDDDDDDARTGPAPRGEDGAAYVLVCDADVDERVCTAVARSAGVASEIEPAGEVIARATSGEQVDWDAWLTLDGVPGVLDIARQQAELPGLTTTAPVDVATSPLALLALPDAPGGCSDAPAIPWSCLVDQGPEGRTGVAVPGPDTALGILTIAAGAAGLEGSRSFSRSAYEGTDNAFRLETFLDDSPSGAGTTTAAQVGAMLNPGRADAAITVAALADRQTQTSQGQGRQPRTIPLVPAVVVGLTLVGLGDDGPGAIDALADGLTGQTVEGALDDAGWTGAAGPTTGLPEDPGLIYALREGLS